ncbi:hypothetical protein B0H21DRAFT_708358 [Amylocystis lapponica]|nr:hypothetical protein B0H21DRAFT_708358 [Amylocystis lapponica]
MLPPGSTAPSSPTTSDSIRRDGSRTLVLCFDDQSSEAFDENINQTNVTKLYVLLRKDLCERQLCYYQTRRYTAPMGCQNRRPGACTYEIGAFRGAYIARAIAAMIDKIGILPVDNLDLLPLAYKLYTKTGSDDVSIAAMFKQNFCRSTVVDFRGCMALLLDEVDEPKRYEETHDYLHKTSSIAQPTTERHIQTQDMASGTTDTCISLSPLDSPISPAHHISPTPAGDSVMVAGSVDVVPVSTTDSPPRPKATRESSSGTSNQSTTPDDTPNVRGSGDILEVWFAGSHSGETEHAVLPRCMRHSFLHTIDVGRDVACDASDGASSLSTISLCWMIDQVKARGDVHFVNDESALRRAGFPEGGPLSAISPEGHSHHDTATGVGDTRNLDGDAIQAGVHDEPKSRIWSGLEFIPTKDANLNGIWRFIKLR